MALHQLGSDGDLKVIIVGDPHVTGTNPVARIDDYTETILKKFEELAEMSENVDVICILGDVFSTPDTSNIVKGNLGRVLSKFKCPVYTIAGNHDLFGGNMTTYKRTGLGLMERLGLINIIKDDDNLFFQKGQLKLLIKGQNYHPMIDMRVKELDYARKKESNATHLIHLVHGYMTSKKLIFPHTLISEIAHLTEADATFSGHYHQPFMEIVGGKYFANPGSLGRTKSSIGEFRRPKVFMVNISQETGVLTVESVYLQSAPPPTEVLSREHLKSEDDESTVKINQFMDKLLTINIKNDHRIDTKSIVERVSTEENIEEEVKVETMKAISEAEDFLDKIHSQEDGNITN